MIPSAAVALVQPTQRANDSSGGAESTEASFQSVFESQLSGDLTDGALPELKIEATVEEAVATTENEDQGDEVIQVLVSTETEVTLPDEASTDVLASHFGSALPSAETPPEGIEPDLSTDRRPIGEGIGRQTPGREGPSVGLPIPGATARQTSENPRVELEAARKLESAPSLGRRAILRTTDGGEPVKAEVLPDAEISPGTRVIPVAQPTTAPQPILQGSSETRAVRAQGKPVLSDIQLASTVERQSEAVSPGLGQALPTKATPSVQTLAFPPLFTGIETKVSTIAADVGDAFHLAESRPTSIERAALAPVPVPVSHQPLAQAQARDIAIQLAANAQSGRFEVTLVPEDLGRVRLTMTPAEVGHVVVLDVERPEVLETVRRNLEFLESAFSDAGFGKMTFSFAGEDGAADAEPSDDETAGDPDAPETVVSQPDTRVLVSGRLDLRL